MLIIFLLTTHKKLRYKYLNVATCYKHIKLCPWFSLSTFVRLHNVLTGDSHTIFFCLNDIF